MQNKEIGGEKSVNEKNLEVFNRYFPGCLSIENDDKLTLDTRKLKALLGDFSEIKEEGYGLDFVGKKIALNQAFKKNHKILKPLNKSTSKHILIKGDNLDALKILKQSYSEKIKMIYIDPPYNTGNDDFIYPDNFRQDYQKILREVGLMEIDENGEEIESESLKFFKNNQGSKTHSGWLSFMLPRLKLARDLLKEDGVIFISIDDNECAQLKLLCDEIFGEDNFVGDFIRKTKSTTNDAKIGLNYQHEFLLCYAKNKEFINLLGGEKNLENYKNPDNDPNGAWISADPSAKSGNMKTGYFGVTNPYTNKVDYPPVGGFWRFSQNTIQKHIDEGRICFKKEHKDNERGFIYKRYLKDLKTTKKTFDSLIFSDNCYMNQAATKELLSLGMGEYFTYPKGVEFMKKIILHSTTPNEGDIILDFFAGSGTTAHAVLESNKSDYQKLSEGGGVI
ncbi:site-specific DNA-methyltransferase [Helicobacter pylori]|nr:site-specific DNA-methyltransferase [Helicobacter pylori]